MPLVQILGYRCERCRHEWRPRDLQREPEVCPKCKSPYWNKPRQSDTKPGNSKKRPRRKRNDTD